MRRAAAYMSVFPLVIVLMAYILSAVRNAAAGAPLMPMTVIFLLMLVPAMVTMAVDRIGRRFIPTTVAGMASVPAAMDVALLPFANPRVFETVYLGASGALAAAVCFIIARHLDKRASR